MVGLYLNPPTNAVVLSLDEKTQVQALSRTQPLLPLRPGLPARQTHDYRRNGLTSLSAALEVATGRVVGAGRSTHTGTDFLHFLKRIAACIAAANCTSSWTTRRRTRCRRFRPGGRRLHGCTCTSRRLGPRG